MSSSVEITVLYFAALREQAGNDSEIIVVAESATAADVYAHLAKHHLFTLPQSRLRAAVNHRFCPWDRVLTAGDTLAFIPPVAGG